MPMRRLAMVMCCALGVGCSDGATAGDAQVTDEQIADGALPATDQPTVADGMADDRGVAGDQPDEGAAPADVLTDDRPGGLDGGARDGGGADVLAIDGGTTDAPDVPPPDARAPDVPPTDVPRLDAPVADLPSAPDVPAVTDGRVVDGPAVDVAADVPADVPVVDAGCLGSGPVVTVASPTSAQVIETCTAAGMPVYFDFTAAVTASARVLSVGVRWITPDGLEAPPPAVLSAAPYRFSRQVGGPSTGTPALSVFGIRGDWRVEFTALDACGRSHTVAQPFSFIFTTRRCPNP